MKIKMDIEHYTYLLANPQKITSEDVAALDNLVQKYPYFQSARALQLKGLKNQDSFRYNDALKITAAHTADRDILFEYITSEKFIQNEISQTILQHDNSILEISVEPEDLSKNFRIQKEKEFKVEKEKADAILSPNLFQRKVKSVADLVSNVDIDPEIKEKNSLIKKENREKKKENSEEQLIVDKPLEFTKNDTHSFTEWLKLTKAKPIQRTTEEPAKQATSDESSAETTAEEEKERKFELIEKFIQERPKISPSLSSDGSQRGPDNRGQKTPEPSPTQPTDSLMTETLARVYLQQKNYKKAIQAYKILILKNPEKSGFFADQIRAIEKLINTEKQ